MPIFNNLYGDWEVEQPVRRNNRSSFRNFLNRINPFRNFNAGEFFEEDVLPTYGPAFVPRGENLDQPSYFDEARNNPIVNAARNVGSRPIYGWLGSGIGAGVLGGVRSGNPYIGIATGVGTLLTGIPELREKQKAYNQAKAIEENEKVAAERTKNIYDTFGKINEFMNEYRENRKKIQEYMDNNLQFQTSIKDFINQYIENNKNKQKNEKQELQIQRAGDQIINNPIKYNNDLKIEHAVSFTIPSENTRAPRMQQTNTASKDKYRHKSVLTSFFNLVPSRSY